MIEAKRLEDIETGQYTLEVYECGCCQFHIGLDASYLDQVGPVTIECPSCSTDICSDDQPYEAKRTDHRHGFTSFTTTKNPLPVNLLDVLHELQRQHICTESQINKALLILSGENL